MTIEGVIELVQNETGQPVIESTELKDLGLDSLEFLDLLLRFPHIPDEIVPRINTVYDLWLATEGKL